MLNLVSERVRRRWELQEQDPATVQQLAADLACPTPIAHLLAARGIVDTGAARRFFEPSIDDLLSETRDPRRMLGVTEAVARIRQAVTAGEPILIYGDYDVDGTTATALLKTAIERIAPKDRPAKVTYHVPHRIREGYGMRTHVLGDAAEAGIRLVISVDTGIRAFEAAREARALGLDLIVTDHHLPDDVEGSPDALAVINPAQAGCPYPFKSLCGAGVAFKLAQALLQAAVGDEAESDSTAACERLRTAILPSFLKLVAIATIADSVPLVDENRVIAALGLRALKNPVQPGLKALIRIARIEPGCAPTATEVGFRLAPRINAAGRMDIAGEVVELLLTRDPERALLLAEKLDRLNQERRDTEARALEEIERQLEQLRGDVRDFPSACIILDDGGWHRGVLGILASRIVDRTARPALVLTHEDGQAHGSGRSVQGFHLLDALTAIDHDGSVFTRFGGHAHAVGFSLPTANLDRLRERMLEHSSRQLTVEILESRLACDLEIQLDEITDEFFHWLERFAPFGQGNPEPLFVSRNVVLAEAPRILKEKHVCLRFQRSDGRLSERLSALGWSRSIDWIARCAELSLTGGSVVDAAYRIKRSAYNGSLELELCDLAAGT